MPFSHLTDRFGSSTQLMKCKCNAKPNYASIANMPDYCSLLDLIASKSSSVPCIVGHRARHMINNTRKNIYCIKDLLCRVRKLNEKMPGGKLLRVTYARMVFRVSVIRSMLGSIQFCTNL